MQVVKRDERRESFDRDKLRKGIERAAERAKIDKARARKIADSVVKDVENNFRKSNDVRSTDIRDRVLDRLNKEERKVADSFRNFRR